MQTQRPKKYRAILTEQQAVEIFGFRSQNSMAKMVSSALVVAKRYGINEKTVRDIWMQRSWAYATSSLAKEIGPMAKKKVGRPMGSRDTCPRKQKLAAEISLSPDSSSKEAASLVDPSSIGREDERMDEASIDDQLHTWAHYGSKWILDAALALDRELIIR
jgi:hypothetical protein